MLSKLLDHFGLKGFSEYNIFPQELWTIACGKLHHKMIIKKDEIDQVNPMENSTLMNFCT